MRADFRIWGLLPAWIIMGFTLIIPIGIVIAVSFAARGAYGGFDWALSGESYVQILYQLGWTDELEFNPQYLYIIARTLWLAAVTTLICMGVSLPVAYYIARQPRAMKAALVYLVTLPFWVSMIVRVYAWLIILGNDGVIEKALVATGLTTGIESLLFNDGAMLVGMTYTPTVGSPCAA